MKLFITGSGGFLGHHILNEISKYDMELFIPRSKELDILDYNNLAGYLSTYQPDCILHMSALCGGIGRNKNRPADFLRENTQMALNIYEAARQNNITKIYSLGSVCAYPKYCPVPFKEDDIWNGFPEETNAPYGLAKKVLLMLGQTYRQQYNFFGAHFIPVNMYGPYDCFDLNNSHVVPALIRKFDHAIDNNLPSVECWGNGTATRELLFAPDASKAICKAIVENFNYEQPINLGVGQDISIKDLVYLLKNIMNYSGDIVFNNNGLDGQPKRMLDTSRAKELLNWEATTSLEDGLRQTIKWYQENKKSII